MRGFGFKIKAVLTFFYGNADARMNQWLAKRNSEPTKDAKPTIQDCGVLQRNASH